VTGASLGTTALAVEDLIAATTFGTHTYQLAVTYDDANDNRNLQLLSNIETINILDVDTQTASGSINLGNILTSTEANVNYTIVPVLDSVTATSLHVYNTQTGALFGTFDQGDALTGNFLISNLASNSEYRVDLVANINGNSVTLNTTSFVTLPANQNENFVYSNVNFVSATDDAAIISVKLNGSNDLLATVTTAEITLNDGQTYPITGNQLSLLKTSQTVQLNLNNLTDDTNYVATLAITGATLHESTDIDVAFRTLPTNNSGAPFPEFTSIGFFQTTLGDNNVTTT